MRISFVILIAAINFNQCMSQTGWIQQFFGIADSYQSVFFINDQTGWIAASGSAGSFTTGSILKTTNGGTNWNSIVSGAVGFKDVKFIDENTGWVIGQSQNGPGKFGRLIFKTTDGGITLSLQHVDSTSYYFLELAVINENNVWVFAPDQRIVKTTDSGMNWISQIVAPGFSSTLADFSILNENTGYVIATFSNLFKTEDSGSNWEQIYGGAKIFWKQVYFVNELTGWMCDGAGSFKKTTNGGVSFDNQYVNSAGIRSLYFVNNNTGWICGSNGTITSTLNGGTNWATQITGGAYASIILNSVYFPDNNSGWCVGFSQSSPRTSLILRTTSGGLTFINSSNNEIPDSYFLNQNFPNPFNPVTKIKFDIPSDVKHQMSNVKLIVYDALGREVQSLVNQKLAPGSYESEFMGSDFAGGVYFYKLETVSFSEVKKMVLLK